VDANRILQIDFVRLS